MGPGYRRGDPGEAPDKGFGGVLRAKRPGPVLVDRARDASKKRRDVYEIVNGLVPLMVSAVSGVFTQSPVLSA